MPRIALWRAAALAAGLLLGPPAAAGGFTGNATQTKCLTSCNAINSSCTSGTNSLQLKARVTYQTRNKTVCPNQGAAFCPVVDQFAAVNLMPLAAEIVACPGMQIELFQGDNTTGEKVLDWVPFTQSNVSKCVATDDLNISAKAYAYMLVFNVTLASGKWNTYTTDNQTMLSGTGFQQTCDSDGVCMYDADLPCIGGDDGKNGFCAKCITRSELSQGAIHPTIYLAFYGTGPDGSRLLSGNQNPLNFRKYALGGVYSVLASATSSYINAFLAFNWTWDGLKGQFESLFPNVTLPNIQLPDFEGILNGVTKTLTNTFTSGNGSAGTTHAIANTAANTAPEV